MRGFSKTSAPPLFLEDENLANPARLGRCMLLSPAASKQYMYSSTAKTFQNSKFKIQNSKIEKFKNRQPGGGTFCHRGLGELSEGTVEGSEYFLDLNLDLLIVLVQL